MSIDLLAAALWLDLEPARKLVLIALCERANVQTGLCWPGLEEIALRASLSRRSTINHLRSLYLLGYIRRVRRGKARHGETTERWLDTKMILDLGERRRTAFLRARPAAETLGAECAPNADQVKLTTSLGEADGIDQVKLTTSLGEAASPGTVIEPS